MLIDRERRRPGRHSRHVTDKNLGGSTMELVADCSLITFADADVDETITWQRTTIDRRAARAL